MLLSHTSGLPDGISLSGKPTVAARRAAVPATPLTAGAVPGRTFRYADTNMLVLGQLLEKLSGRPLDALVRDGVTGPLGMRDTGFTPLSRLPADRLVATDVHRARGVVHDPNALALGGVAGHAGLFGTAADIAVLGQALLDGGQYRGRRILAAETVRRMLVNVDKGLPAIDNPAHRPGWSSSHGYGLKLDQPWFMGRLSSPQTFGHTGFTGTSFLVDPRRRLVLVLLTNAAHPDWRRSTVDRARVAVANAFA
jgi:CubicO group peptidase (beta-lactamase class C family)